MLKVVGLLLLAAGWVLVLRGLFLLPVPDDPELDLEAGPAFALNVSVYLPALALTVLLVVAIPCAAAVSRGAEVGVVIAAVVGGFVWWVLTQEPLLRYIPGLRNGLLLAAAVTGMGLLVLCVTLATNGPAPPSRDARAGEAPQPS